MKMHYAAVMACGFLLSAGSTPIPKDEAKTGDGPKVDQPLLPQPVFADDFHRDTRADYDIKGHVTWEVGSLRLGDGASIRRAINTGAWAKVDLNVTLPTPTDETSVSELQIWFVLESATPCLVRLRQTLNNRERVISAAVVDTGEKDGKPIQSLVREVRLSTAAIGQLAVEYRHGLLELSSAEKSLLLAYIENGAANVVQLEIRAISTALQIRRLKAVGTPAASALTAEQQRQLNEAKAAKSKLAQVYLHGDFAEAARIAERVLKIHKTVLGTEHPDYAHSLNNLAAVYDMMNAHARAEPLYLEARDIWRRVLGTAHPAYAGSLYNLASLYLSMGEYANAERLYIEAHDIRKRALGTEHADYVASLNGLAVLYHSIGEYAKAESLLSEARNTGRRLVGADDRVYASILRTLAILYDSMGEYAKAEPLLLEAREILKRLQGTDHPDDAAILITLARLYQAMGEYAKAEPLYLEARDILKNKLGTDHPHYAISLNGLAWLYGSMGEYAKAEALDLQARDIFKRVLGTEHLSYAQCLSNLALRYEAMGEYGRATELLRAAHAAQLAAAEKSLPSLSEAQAVNWMRQNRPRTDSLLANLRRLDRQDSVAAHAAIWCSKSLISRLHASQFIRDDASPEARQVFAELRDARQQLARLVSATPAPQQAKAYQAAMATANERKESLEKKLIQLSPATRRALAIRDASIDDLLERLPRGVALIDCVLVHDWDFVETQIAVTREDGTTETRAVKKEQATPVYDAFILRGDRGGNDSAVSWIALGLAEPIDNAIAAWRRQLTRTSEVATRELGKKSFPVPTEKPPADSDATDPRAELRQRIWDKLEPQLEGCHTVILLPDGALHRLPWAALPGRKPQTYLIEDYALGTAAYGQQLFGLLSDEAPADEQRLLVAGGIRYDQRHKDAPPAQPDVGASQLASRRRGLELSTKDRIWKYLDGAEREAKTVRDLWADRGQSVLLEGVTADERNIAEALSRSRYAHLATHGFFDKAADVYPVNLREQLLFDTDIVGGLRGATVAARNPLLTTGIVLAGANLGPVKDALGIPTGDDGILTAEEIIGLNLRNTELVTLSACETGLGDVAAGEGVFGLQRALHQAGVRSVVASLWNVSDTTTEVLMTEFYRNLWDKKLSKLEALRQAQLALIERYDIRTGQLRGLGTKSEAVNTKAIKDSSSKLHRLPAEYWAGFQLSGDWR